MNAPKLRPMPIGSMIVNRTWPGGRLVSSRNIDAWSTSSAAPRPSAGVSINRLALGGERPQGGEVERRRHAFHQSASARDAAGQRGKIERDRAEANHGRDEPGQRARLPGRVVPVGAVAVDLAIDRVELGRGLLHAVAPAVGHAQSTRFRTRMRIRSLNALYFSSSLG